MQTLRSILALALLALMLGAGATGCSRQESEWRRVRAQDTVAGYEDYLQRRPLGPHAEEARERLRALREERAWERALRLDAPEAFQQYLGAYPDGRFAEEARERLADFLLARAPSTGPAESAAPVSTPPRPSQAPAAKPAASPAPVVTKAKPAPANTKPPVSPAAKPAAAPQSQAVKQSAPKAAAAPAPRPALVTATTKPRATATPPAAASGAWRVQLGAFGAGEAAARSAWERLRAAHRTELAGLEPEFDTLMRDGRTLWRLRAGRVDGERARRICAVLRTRGAACAVVAP